MLPALMPAPLLIVLLWIGSFVPPEPQSADPSSPAQAACTVCRGTGKFQQECLDCGGDGDRGCPRCNVEVYTLAAARDEAATPADIDLRERNKELERAMSKLLRAGAPAGFMRCPANCFEGKAAFTSNSECKYCTGKGALPCPTCSRKGTVKCTSCAGRGQVVRACEACNGSKTTADAKLAPQELRAKCPWCADARIRECTDCESDGRMGGPCPACAGTGSTKCAGCLGSKSEPCKRCSGSGLVESPLTGKSDCPVCHRKGRLDCTTCRMKGVTTCGACSGSKTVRRLCPACGSDHKRPCLGCFHGATESWERTADLLQKAGDAPNAIGWLEGARSHVAKDQAEIVASLERLEADLKKLLEQARGPEPPRFADGKPIDVEFVQKKLDEIPQRKTAEAETLRARDAALRKKIEALRGK